MTRDVGSDAYLHASGQPRTGQHELIHAGVFNELSKWLIPMVRRGLTPVAPAITMVETHLLT